jgi:hypothetical protein
VFGTAAVVFGSDSTFRSRGVCFRYLLAVSSGGPFTSVSLVSCPSPKLGATTNRRSRQFVYVFSLRVHTHPVGGGIEAHTSYRRVRLFLLMHLVVAFVVASVLADRRAPFRPLLRNSIRAAELFSAGEARTERFVEERGHRSERLVY